MGVVDDETGGQDYMSQGTYDEGSGSSYLGQLVHDTQESETGCCICTCKDSFLCKSLHAWYKCCFLLFVEVASWIFVAFVAFAALSMLVCMIIIIVQMYRVA